MEWHDTVTLHKQNDANAKGNIHDLYEVNVNDHRLGRGEHIGQGDILFTKGEEEAIFGNGKSNDDDVKRDALRSSSARWPNAVVPYVISRANTKGRNAINAAIAEYSAKTCIKFVKRTNQKDYIKIIQGGGCYSYIGRIGRSQGVSIGIHCEYKSTVVHEFMHALGFFHEQSRPDRDSYVRIIHQNVLKGYDSQFKRESANSVTTFNHAYDIESVMHYDKYAFSKSYGRLPTIVAKNNPNGKLGQPLSGGLSEIDVKQLKAMYCSGDPNCVDKEESCGYWKRKGYCMGSYEAYMKKYCCKSCSN